MEPTLQLTPDMLGDDAAAVARARRAVRRFLTTAVDADPLRRDAGRTSGTMLVDDVVLVVSELVTNALIHTDRTPSVEVRVIDADHVVVAVDDPSERIPHAVTPTPETVGGRGLRIVGTVATRWGVCVVPGDGKTVWAEMRSSAATTSMPVSASFEGVGCGVPRRA